MSDLKEKQQAVAAEIEAESRGHFPVPLVICLQIIAVSFIAAPMAITSIQRAGHDVPEGYEYLAKSRKSSFYYTKLGGKFESVQVLQTHVIDQDNKAESFSVPVDCETKEVGGKSPNYRTIGAKMIDRACRN